MKRLAVALVIMAAPVQAADLKIISIDVEGGAATLYVTPEGRSLLIDTGWPAGRGAPRAAPGEPPVPASLSSAERIVAAAVLDREAVRLVSATCVFDVPENRR